jgi:hypothetical protein
MRFGAKVRDQSERDQVLDQPLNRAGDQAALGFESGDAGQLLDLGFGACGCGFDQCDNGFVGGSGSLLAQRAGEITKGALCAAGVFEILLGGGAGLLGFGRFGSRMRLGDCFGDALVEVAGAGLFVGVGHGVKGRCLDEVEAHGGSCSPACMVGMGVCGSGRVRRAYVVESPNEKTLRLSSDRLQAGLTPGRDPAR